MSRLDLVGGLAQGMDIVDAHRVVALQSSPATYNDTYITLAARNAMYAIIAVGCALLLLGTACQAMAVEKRMAVEARV